jgi:aryl-alcohol dehydrogenase-like predicted oxidoreductase
MRYRTFPKTGWPISEIGHGLWGMGGWTGSNDEESGRALDRAIALGCNFFDTAWVYGLGRSEKLLGAALRRHPTHSLIVATKAPPRNMAWPAGPGVPIADVYPPGHLLEYTERSLENLGLSRLDLQQFHVWNDEWAEDPSWQREVARLKDTGLVRTIGISVNRWEPANVLKALETGLIDAVQVVYNIFDQAPEDDLLPYCRERGIAVLARVPFDEGSLTGTLTPASAWPASDWRNRYFSPETLPETLERITRIEPLLPEHMSLPELALRFILENPAVTTTIPGMRRVRHVEENLAVSDGRPLPPRLRDALRAHRWDRVPSGPL